MIRIMRTRQIINTLGNMGWVSVDHGLGGDIFSNDTAGPNKSILTDDDVWQYGDVCTDPSSPSDLRSAFACTGLTTGMGIVGYHHARR
jgi:hypothetical protein